MADAAHLTYNDQWNPIRSKNDYARGCQKFKNHMEESQINILNNKQMSRSGSHRYETHTKTNYENNEYIYLGQSYPPLEHLHDIGITELIV